MKKRLIILCLIFLLWIGTVPVSALVSSSDIDAQAALLMDADTGQVLFEKNGYGRM